MGKVRITILLAAILITVRANAYYKLVIDPWTTAAVTANAASQELIESQHAVHRDHGHYQGTLQTVDGKR